MSEQIKQRIVGFCVLIFLALIIFPWLFGSNQAPVSLEKKAINSKKHLKPTLVPIPGAITAVNNTNMTPLNTQTMIPESVTPSSNDTSPIHEPKTSDKAEDLTTKTVKTMSPERLSTIETAIVQAKPSVKILPPKIKLSKPPINIVQLPKKAPAKSKSLTKLWIVQLGSFSQADNAKKLAQQLKTRGYLVNIEKSKNAQGVSMTRVYLGPGSKESAENWVKRVEKSLNVHGVIKKKD